MYQRTRPGWRPGRFPPARFLPAPPWWAILASVVGGLLVMLLPLWHLAVVACPPLNGLGTQRCLALGNGYPAAYRFQSGILTMHRSGIHWLDVVAPSGVRAVDFAADWAMWSLGFLLAAYLIWLSMTREDADPGTWVLVHGQPVGP